MKNLTAHITVNNKKYSYTLKQKGDDLIFVECEGANMAQDFLAEDVPSLLLDLPNLIIAEKEHTKKNSEMIRFRVSPSDKSVIEKRAVKEGYASLSDYLRHLALG